MASPIAHGIIGATLAVAALLPRGADRREARRSVRRHYPEALLILFAACAPDLDYLPGLVTGQLSAFHQATSHSFVWCVMLATGLWCLMRYVRPGIRIDLLFWLTAAALSHLAVDLVTVDLSQPIGFPIGWPFSATFAKAPFNLFLYPSKTQPVSLWNLLVASWEILLTGTLLLLVLHRKGIGSSQNLMGRFRD